MKKNYGLILTFLFLFVSGIMNAQMKADFMGRVYGKNIEFFNYTASNPPTSSLTYKWDFGDGSNNYFTNGKTHIVHTYSQIGTYTVTLIATDTTGTFPNDTFSDNFDIVCIADFNYNISGNSVSFTDATIIDTVKVTSSKIDYFWIYSDSNKLKQNKNDSHTFPTNGTYDVIHIVYDGTTGSGCRDTIIKTINLNQVSCNLHFRDSLFMDSTHILLVDQTSSSSAFYIWDFGDGTSGNGDVTMHTFNQGTYNVCVTILDSVNNCFTTYCDTVEVYKSATNCAGTAAFGYTINSGNNVSFMADSLIGNSAAFYWSFGDGNSSNQRNPNHTYSSTGNYNVKMVYYDATTGCLDSIINTVNLTTSSCQANYSFNISTSIVVFNNSSTAANLSAVKYTWDFGDGNFSTQKNPTHNYTQGNSNIVVLSINDTIANCTNSYVDTIIITCNSNFTYIVSGDSVQFTNTSGIPSGSTYLWYFDDGDTSNLENPLHVYPHANNSYNVSLHTISPSGCSDVRYEIITIGNPKQAIDVWFQKNPAGTTFIGAYAARLYLIKYDSANQTLTAIDSVDKFNDSMHLFKNVTAGKYLVKIALLASDSDYYDYLPTYGDTSLTWSNATIINHGNTTTSFQGIYMRKGTNPGGSGFIAGYVYQGANKKEGPLENIDVYLTLKDGTPVTFAKTDIEGKYEFNNLAFGEYKIRVEILGKTSEEYNVVIDQNTPSAMENNFDVNKNEIVKRTPNASVKNIQNNNLKLYPNPVNDYLNIELENDAENIAIEIYDISGSLVLKNKMNSNEKIDVSNIKTGIYFIQIQTDNLTIYRQKFLKD